MGLVSTAAEAEQEVEARRAATRKIPGRMKRENREERLVTLRTMFNVDTPKLM
jgi:hypothetical protein